MCGIIGSVKLGEPVSHGALERGLDSIVHRGPDDGGYWSLVVSEPQPIHVWLGNRRLAILDLSSAGHQPMQDPDTGNWIVYNGEIYNFADSRHTLEAEGVHFQSRTDTEVILKAYARWGDACLERFRGMFAFALWDAGRRRLFLARDRFGEKPLYFSFRDGHLIFASEIRALLRTGLVPRKLNAPGLYQYLSFGSVYDPATFLQDVQSLPPAHVLSWEEGRLNHYRYWDLESPGRDIGGPNRGNVAPDQVRRELRELLEDTISLRTVSDVPVGVFLSGGIDSSSIAALLAQARPGQVNTFCIAFTQEEYGEARFARTVADRLKTDHFETMLSSDSALRYVPYALAAMDQPTIDGVNSYIVSQETRRRGLKVALSGLGGDEIFAGYSSFRTVPQMERAAWLLGGVNMHWRHVGAALLRVLARDNDRSRKLRSLVDGETAHPYLLSRMLFTPRQVGDMVQSDVGRQAATAMEPLLSTLSYARRFDPVNRVSYLETHNYMANTLLRDTDCMSMAHSLEVRAPFLDHILVEYVFSVPGTRKLNNGQPKPLLTGALASLLPPEIVHRPKTGFGLPFEYWMRESLRPNVAQVLEKDWSLGEYVRDESARQVWKSFLDQRTSWSRPWSLYVLDSWARRHLA
jgi:asparagine synthase (glutamine-hydrolysing)